MKELGVDALLILAAAICAGLAAFGVTTRVHLGWVAVCLFLVTQLF